MNDNGGDDDEGLEAKSPLSHKKAPLNKTQGGRIQKPQTPKKKLGSQTIVNLDDEEDDLIKQETHVDFENHGFEIQGHSFGYNDADIDMDHEQFYESHEDVA